MRSRWLILLLLGCSVLAQTKKPAQKPAPSAQAPVAPGPAPASTDRIVPPDASPVQSAAAVPDNAPVLTLEGVCADPTATPCRTQVTKAEFDSMMSVTAPPGAPPMPPMMKRERANQLAQLLSVAIAAEKAGVQNTPEGKQMIELARLEALAKTYVRNLQQTSKPTDAEVESYYNSNPEKFQQATLKQLFVPPLKSTTAGPANEEAKKARAEKFRQRLVAGEPFDKLQKEAIEGTSYQTPPPVDLTVQRDSLQPARQFVFNLKDSEISSVISEPAGAVIYKMISKTSAPLAQVRENISRRLTQEKFQAKMEALLKSVNPTLNDAYFGPARPQAVPGPAPMVPSPAATPSPTPQQPQ